MEGIKREYTSDERSPIIDPELRDNNRARNASG